MPEKTQKTIVTNTSPLIALAAAWGTLELHFLDRVLIIGGNC